MSSNIVNYMLNTKQILIINPYKVALWREALCLSVSASLEQSNASLRWHTAPLSECPWTAISDEDAFSKEHTHAARQHLL